MTTSKRLVAAGAAAVLTASLAACSSSSKPSGAASPAPSVSATASAPAASDTTTAPTTPVPTTPPAEAANLCRLSELTVSVGQGNAGAGSLYVPILFRNTGGRTCQLFGYPGIAGLNAAGRQVVQAVRTASLSGGPAHLVTLPPGQTTSAVVRGNHISSGSAPCPTYPKLLVTPPGETHSTVVTASIQSCSGLAVGTIVLGVTGTSTG